MARVEEVHCMDPLFSRYSTIDSCAKWSGYTAVTKKTKIFQIALDELRNEEKEIARHVEEEGFRRGI